MTLPAIFGIATAPIEPGALAIFLPDFLYFKIPVISQDLLSIFPSALSGSIPG
jgi:hypothetical protein